MAPTDTDFPLEGGCTCRQVRYRVTTRPLIVHCCHCTWCQRETGSAFAVNAMIEAERVEVTAGTPEAIHTPSLSGKGQVIWRCATCQIALWSNYGGRGDVLRFVRVGTLDRPTALPPDVHIFTSTKQPWVALPDDARVFEEYYSVTEEWSPESLERRAAIRARQNA